MFCRAQKRKDSNSPLCVCLLSPQEQRDILHGLRQAAFETESENSLSHERRRSLCAKEFRKLGFSVSVRSYKVTVCLPAFLSFICDTFFLPFRIIATPVRTCHERLLVS